jgi:actin-related protein
LGRPLTNINMNDFEKLICIDFGNLWIKFGYSGEDTPRYCLPFKDQENAIFATCSMICDLLLVTNNNKVIVVEGPAMLKAKKEAIANSFKQLKVFIQNVIRKFHSIIWVPTSFAVMLALGKTTGIAVDMGFNSTSIVPVKVNCINSKDI